MDAATLLTLAGLIVASTALGLWWRARQGVVRSGDGRVVPLHLIEPTKKLTLVQVSAPLCPYCSAMRGILAKASSNHEAVAHLEYDVSEIPGVVEKLQIRQTPTTLFVEADGRVAHQVGGPINPQALEALITDTLNDVRKRSNEFTI